MQLSLLPIYRTKSPTAFPTSYTPDWYRGSALITSILNGVHLVLSGISRLPISHPFCTSLVIDGNDPPTLPLAEMLGGLPWTGKPFA